LKKFQMAISPQRLTIYLYSTHRAVVFAIAQLSCKTSRFYRAMHFSAKRGFAIASRLSVWPSVCNVDGLWSHRLEFFRNNFTIIAYGMDVRSIVLCRPKHQWSTPRGTHRNFGPNWRTPCWFERRRHSIANYSRILQIAQRSQWRA